MLCCLPAELRGESTPLMILPSIIVGLVGFIPLAIVLYKRSRINKLKKHGTYVTGVVQDIIERRGYKGITYSKAIIQYPVRGGSPMINNFNYSSGQTKKLLTRGQQVEVVYDNNLKRFTLTILPDNIPILVFTIIIAIVYIAMCFLLYNSIKNGEI